MKTLIIMAILGMAFGEKVVFPDAVNYIEISNRNSTMISCEAGKIEEEIHNERAGINVQFLRNGQELVVQFEVLRDAMGNERAKDINAELSVKCNKRNYRLMLVPVDEEIGAHIVLRERAGTIKGNMKIGNAGVGIATAMFLRDIEAGDSDKYQKAKVVEKKKKHKGNEVVTKYMYFLEDGVVITELEYTNKFGTAVELDENELMDQLNPRAYACSLSKMVVMPGQNAKIYLVHQE